MRKLHELPVVGKLKPESPDPGMKSPVGTGNQSNQAVFTSTVSPTERVGQESCFGETNPRIHPTRGLRGRCWIRTNVGEPTVLQTAPFGHSGNLPCWREPAIENTSRRAGVVTNPARHQARRTSQDHRVWPCDEAPRPHAELDNVDMSGPTCQGVSYDHQHPHIEELMTLYNSVG